MTVWHSAVKQQQFNKQSDALKEYSHDKNHADIIFLQEVIQVWNSIWKNGLQVAGQMWHHGGKFLQSLK